MENFPQSKTRDVMGIEDETAYCRCSQGKNDTCSAEICGTKNESATAFQKSDKQINTTKEVAKVAGVRVKKHSQS